MLAPSYSLIACGLKISHVRGKIKADSPESLKVQTLSDGKRGDLAIEAGTEIVHRILPGAMHQDEAVEFERGKIGCSAFKSIFTGMPQVKPANDGANGDVRTGSPAGFDRVDDPGMATAGNQYTGSQQERLFLRDEIRHCACLTGKEMPAAVLARFAWDRAGQEHVGINLCEGIDFSNSAFIQDTLRFRWHSDSVFRAIVVQAPARFHYSSPDIDRSLRRRVKFRKPARMVVMPVRQYDICGRIKVDSH